MEGREGSEWRRKGVGRKRRVEGRGRRDGRGGGKGRREEIQNSSGRRERKGESTNQLLHRVAARLTFMAAAR